MKKNFKWAAGIFGGLMIVGIMSRQNEVKDAPAVGSNTNAVEQAATATPKNEPSKPVDLVAELHGLLDSAILRIDKGIPSSEFRGSQTALELEFSWFAQYSKALRDASLSDDKGILTKSAKLKTKLSAIQAREFPLMRKEIASIWAEKLWEENIKIRTFGKGNTVIEFVGGTFASNKNIKSTQETMSETLGKYRFKRSQYKWIPSEEEYTYYDIEPLADTEPYVSR